MKTCHLLSLVLVCSVTANATAADKLKQKQFSTHAHQASASTWFSSGDPDPDYPPPAAEVRDGILFVIGTQQRDQIRVTWQGEDIRVRVEPIEGDYTNENTLDVVLEGAFVVVLFGLAGDDVLRNDTELPDAMYGGLGDDRMQGGSGPSFLYGQDGDDVMEGRAGDDFLDGMAGNDGMAGGAGADILVGGAGNDELSGGDIPNYPGKGFIDYEPCSDAWVDTISGGSGEDGFVNSYGKDPMDDWTDFSPKSGDIILNL